MSFVSPATPRRRQTRAPLVLMAYKVAACCRPGCVNVTRCRGCPKCIPNTTLASNPCAVKRACCDPATGNCFVLTQPECDLIGGIDQGSGTACMPNPCDDGACCDPVTGACTITPDALGCQIIGGIFLGFGSMCSVTECLSAGTAVCRPRAIASTPPPSTAQPRRHIPGHWYTL